MMWLRKSFVHLLASLLLLSLLVLGVSTAIAQNFSKPTKVEGWLADSNIYGHFVKDVILQSDQSIGSSQQMSGISLSDTAVQQAAQSAFPTSLIKKSINDVLDANYAWLQGKTATPEFKVDLTAAKQSFAQQVGTYVTNYFSSLPVCTAAQAAQLTNIDPLSAPCRPSNVTAQQEGQMVQQQLTEGGSFLTKSVLTPATLNPDQKADSQPYYQNQKLQHLPKIYRTAVAIPWIALAVAVVTALGVIFIYPVRRRGVRKVGYGLVIAGVLLLASKFVVDAVFNHVKKSTFNNSSVGELQKSLTNFLGRAEHGVTQTEVYLAVVFIVLAVIIFVTLIVTRDKGTKTADAPVNEPVADAPAPTDNVAPAATKPVVKPTAPTVSKPKTAGPIGGRPKPGGPKRPRLIQ
ncbi:MAG TPA: hypothetical protein VHB51_00750 [Candidatus Saccharimonadales bacterium]|nr:hypothetical protein [Candidatus Saccharimonadales bacterium]